MGFGKKIALTAAILGFGTLVTTPILAAAVVVSISGGNSCSAASSVTLAGSDQLTGITADAYLAQFSQSEQASKLAIASTIYGVGSKRNPAETPEAIATAIAAGIQESNLTNDLGKASDGSDSSGVFQERPSQGWGTREQVLDVTYASNKWFETLHRNVKDIEPMAMIDIAIAVENPSRAAYHSRWNWDKTGAELYAQVAAPGATNSCQTTGWQLPLAAKTYRISSVFGMRLDPIDHQVQLHDGVDLAAAKDTPVHSIHSGTVIFAGPNGDYGNYVGLDNGGGTITGYAHLNSIAIGLKKGDAVNVGEVIGYVGTTGGSTGNHLHFLLHLNGKPADPVAFLNSNGVSIIDGAKG